MKILFLLNPSGRVPRWDLREMAARAARPAGWTVHFADIERDRPQTSAHLLRQAVDENCTRVVVVGGDGTLHRTVNELHHLHKLAITEIATVPAGTCNDFARWLGLSHRRMEAAFRLACTGQARPTDLGWMGDREGVLFLNNAGFGRRPLATPARRLTKPLRTLRNFQALHLRATWDKGSVEGSFFMGLICNAPFFSKGLHFSRAGRVDDGRLEFYLLPATAKWKLLPLLVKGRLGRPINARRALRLQTEKILVESNADLWPQADGEPPTKAVRRVQFSVAPEKAMIVTPESATP